MKANIIAIDGPAGAGKSTVARLVARKLGYLYIDTGAMYRAVAWAAQAKGVSIDDAAALTELAGSVSIRLADVDGRQQVSADGCDITDAIRTPAVSRSVSAVAAVPGVRAALLTQQRQMAAAGGVVMDGRDIGTCVLPDADVKIFLTASIDERARRRCLELQSNGFAADQAQLRQEIADRDQMDCERETAPLRQAEDAVSIDTSNLTIEQAVAEIVAVHEKRCRS